MKKFILRIVACLMMAVMIGTCTGNVGTALADGAAHSGSATFSDSGWWTEYELTEKDILGDVNPDDVECVEFYSDTTFNIGYSPVSGDWSIGADETSYKVSDLRWGDLTFKLGLSKADGVDYTIKWNVWTKGTAPKEEPKTEEPAGAGKEFKMTTSSTNWGGTNSIPASAFEEFKAGGVKIVLEFEQEDAEWWNIAVCQNVDGWPKVSLVSPKVNSSGYIDTFAKGDTSITVEVGPEGVAEIIASNGVLFQVKALNITKATLLPLAAAEAEPTPEPTATATPTPEPTATPVPTATPEPTATPVPTEVPAEEPKEEPAETPAEEPKEEPAETPAEEPKEEPAETPAEEPKEEPAETPAEEPKEEPAETPATSDKTTTGREVKEGETVYTVKKGDCLWVIAKKFLGKGSRYTELFERNSDILTDPTLIKKGQEIIIPAK